jgi:hypothetical protein
MIESVMLDSTQNEIMSDDDINTFERVCGEDFLPWYLPRVYQAEYTGVSCQVISQSVLDNRRRLEEDTSNFQILAGNVAILFRVRSIVDLPQGTEFDVIVELAFERYVGAFQKLLSSETEYYKSPDAAPAGIVVDAEVEKTSNLPIMIILASALGGGILAIGVALSHLRHTAPKDGPRETPHNVHDVTDDSMMLLFDKGDRRQKRKEEKEDESVNPYLPPTPMGVGVPSEIGPDSWIEPTDDLSPASQEDNQRIETTIYVGGKRADPFNFDTSTPRNSKEAEPVGMALVPKTRAAQILQSLASMASDPSTGANATAFSSAQVPRLETVESLEPTDDDDTRRTLSSKESHPTKSSSDTRPTNHSDGSSTLHGLALVGDGSSMAPSDYDSDPTEKRSFFRKVIQRKPAPKKSHPKQPFSNPDAKPLEHRRLTLPLPSPPPREARDDSPSFPRTQRSDASKPTARASREDASSFPRRQRSDGNISKGNLKNSTPKTNNSSKTQTASSKASPSSNKTNRSRSASPYSSLYQPKPAVRPGMRPRPQLQAPGPSPRTGRSPANSYLKQSDSHESVSVDPRRAAGTPKDPKSKATPRQARYEDCTIRSPVESFVRKNETPKGTRFLQMSTDSAKHTGTVLEDLGRLEEEWDGQLDSKLSATATTPRRTNSEKFRKAPRQSIYREENMI